MPELDAPPLNKNLIGLIFWEMRTDSTVNNKKKRKNANEFIWVTREWQVQIVWNFALKFVNIKTVN